MPIDTSRLTKTIDPYVWIEAQRKGYVRYVEIKSGRRWEVTGECIKFGKCYEDSTYPRNRAEVDALGLDCPVGPGFSGDCCPLIITILPSVDPT